jgi:hypothetical protein
LVARDGEAGGIEVPEEERGGAVGGVVDVCEVRWFFSVRKREMGWEEVRRTVDIVIFVILLDDLAAPEGVDDCGSGLSPHKVKSRNNIDNIRSCASVEERNIVQCESMAISSALDVSLLSPSACMCWNRVDMIALSVSGGARCTIRRASTSHAVAGVALN